MPTTPGPLTITLLARRWHVSYETTRRMVVEQHLFPGAFRVGRQWRIPLVDVETYETEQLKGARE